MAAEVIFQKIQRQKLCAVDALQSGDTDAATRLYEGALNNIRQYCATTPLDRRADFDNDRVEIEDSLVHLLASGL